MGPKKGAQLKFVLPVEVPEAIAADLVTDQLRAAFRHRTCKWAWCKMHTIGRRKHTRLIATSDKLVVTNHQNAGNHNRQKPLREALDSVAEKLTWAQENLACPFATKIVKDMAGLVSLRYDSEDENALVYLPPSATKRGLWLDWVRSRGWDPIQTCKNRRIFEKKRQVGHITWVLQNTRGGYLSTAN